MGLKKSLFSLPQIKAFKGLKSEQKVLKCIKLWHKIVHALLKMYIFLSIRVGYIHVFNRYGTGSVHGIRYQYPTVPFFVTLHCVKTKTFI